MEILRETKAFRVVKHETQRSVARLVAKSGTPRARCLRASEWEYLKPLNDATFDAACVMDFGVGVFER